jgi:predicted aspartyl protease
MRRPRRPPRSIFCFVLVLLLAGCPIDTMPERVEAPAEPEAGEVPFELVGPAGAALTVPVHINGQGPFEFVLDTGATLTCVDDAIAEQLALPERRGVGGVGVGVHGAERVRLVGIDSIRVGEARAFELQACALDLAHAEVIGVAVQGLLGLNFLRNFLVTLDFERNLLTLQEP